MNNKHTRNILFFIVVLTMMSTSLVSATSPYQGQAFTSKNSTQTAKVTEKNKTTAVSKNVVAKRGKSKYVYITKTGKKYHKKSCQHLRKSKKKITRKKAKKLGYKACKTCKP